LKRGFTLIGSRQGLEEFDDNDHSLVVTSLDDRGDFLKRKLEQLAEGQNTELNVVDPGERLNVLEPGGEERRRPALGFEDLNGKPRVVIDRIHHNLLRAHLEQGGFRVGDEVVSELEEGRNELVDGAGEVKQEDLAELTGAGLLNLSRVVVIDNLPPC